MVIPKIKLTAICNSSIALADYVPDLMSVLPISVLANAPQVAKRAPLLAVGAPLVSERAPLLAVGAPLVAERAPLVAERAPLLD